MEKFKKKAISGVSFPLEVDDGTCVAAQCRDHS